MLFLNQLRKIGRLIRSEKYRRINQNNDFTFITNNCIAGLLYHDLNLEFKSPIINMYILADDYIRLLNDFDFYLENELLELKDIDKAYPIGTIGLNEKMITLHFLHFKDFNHLGYQGQRIIACKLWKL